MKKLLILSIVLALLLAACGTAVPDEPIEIISETTAEHTTSTEYETTAQATTSTSMTRTPYAATINIRPMLLQPFAEVQHLFGNVVHREQGYRGEVIKYDTGVLVSANGGLWIIFVGYSGRDDRFHFDGLTFGSTYDDVVTHFGFAGGRRDDEHRPADAVFSYLYTYDEHSNWGGFTEEWGVLGARFFFNADNIVVAFQWFIPV
ncbi:MAG: hypothetical protein FWE40_00885 [Oscillospiraceae bacterium]|nr:hypothetical protein [Oscillospiraceae bacterium]